MSLGDVSGLAERLRSVKDPWEIEAIRRSMDVCGKAYVQTLQKIKLGMTENAIAAELEYRMRRLGAEKPSFETIVAAGERSALPHAQPTGSRLEANQLRQRHDACGPHRPGVQVGKAVVRRGPGSAYGGV